MCDSPEFRIYIINVRNTKQGHGMPEFIHISLAFIALGKIKGILQPHHMVRLFFFFFHLKIILDWIILQFLRILKCI